MAVSLHQSIYREENKHVHGVAEGPMVTRRALKANILSGASTSLEPKGFARTSKLITFVAVLSVASCKNMYNTQ